MGYISKEIGMNSLMSLKTQGNNINNINNDSSYSQAQNEIDSALTDLHIKEIKNKASLLIIFILQVFILLLILYIKIN